MENVPFRPYPIIKCNISLRDGSKIYHLPFDQQYDRTLIECKDECYVQTVAEAGRESSVFIETCQLHCGSGRIGSFSTRTIVTSPRMFMFSGNGIQRNSGLIRSDWNEAGGSGHRSCLKSRG